MLQRTRFINKIRMLKRTRFINKITMLQRTRFINKIRMLQRTRFINKIKMLQLTRFINKIRMLQRTRFINKIRMLQRTQMLKRTRSTRVAWRVRTVTQRISNYDSSPSSSLWFFLMIFIRESLFIFSLGKIVHAFLCFYYGKFDYNFQKRKIVYALHVG